MVISVVNKSSLGWLLAWLKRGSLGWLKGAVYKWLCEWLKRSSLEWLLA